MSPRYSIDYPTVMRRPATSRFFRLYYDCLTEFIERVASGDIYWR